MAPVDCGFQRSTNNRAAFAPRFLCERQPGQGALVAAGGPLLGGLLLREGLFLAKLELRLREDVELQREAPVPVPEGDPRAVPVALAAFAGVDDVDGLAQSEVCEVLQLSKTRISRFHSAGVETVQKLLLLGSALEQEHVAKSVAQLSERRPREVLLALYRDRLNYPSARSKLGVGADGARGTSSGGACGACGLPQPVAFTQSLMGESSNRGRRLYPRNISSLPESRGGSVSALAPAVASGATLSTSTANAA